MKKLLSFLLGASSLLFAQEQVKKEPSYSLWDYHPLHTGGNFIYIGKANVTETPLKGNLSFNKENVFLQMLLPISKTSYFFPRVEWNTFNLDWDRNPRFNQHRFQYLQFGLTFYTIAFDKWRWIFRASYNFDLAHMNHPKEYGLFEALMWGSYKIHPKWHYHVGAFGYTGMRGEQVYPVIGADFSPNKHWTFLAIFPIDYAIQYKVGDHWRFSFKGRPLKERFRTGSKNPDPKSVFSYSTMGAELNVHYEILLKLEVEVFGGYNFGGPFYIKNAQGQNALYTQVEGAPYVGATLDYGF